MDTNNKQEQKKELLRKIGRYSTAAGAVLLSGNLANAAVQMTTTTIDLTFGSDHGIDFDQDGLNELSIYVYTSIWSSSDPAAFIHLGSDPDATSFEVLQGGPFGGNGDLAPLPYGRTIGSDLAGNSYWSDSSWDTIVWTYWGSNIYDGNFGYYPDETRYAGVRFTNNAGSTWYYGWIGIQINSQPLTGTGTVGEIINYAYEMYPNGAILAGSATSTVVPLMPIASALGLGLIGLFGFLRARRKKHQ